MNSLTSLNVSGIAGVVLFLIKGGTGEFSGRERFDSVGTPSGSGDADRTLSLPAMLPNGYAPCFGASTSKMDQADSLPQGGNWTRKLGRRGRNLGVRQMHRHGGLPTTLSRARAGVRLQPVPGAAPQGQPYYPDSSRLVLHSCSGPIQNGPSPSHPDRGDRFSSVLSLTRNQDTVLRNKYARMIKVSRHNTFPSPQQPSPSSTEPERSEPSGP